MDDPILRRLPDMQQSQQSGAKVTLPSISQVAPVARAGQHGRDAYPGNGGAARAGSQSRSDAQFGVYATNSPPVKSESPPRLRTEPPDTMHQPLKPKTRAYSSTAAGASGNGTSSGNGGQALASLAKRRHSSGTQAAPSLAAAKPSATAKTRSKSSSLSARAKQRAQSFTYGEPGASAGVAANGKPLNTHSPIAVAAAAAVTSDKISKLLAAQGPLPIRHITSHLSATIPGFGELSLSKQRRLIIAVLDGPRSDFVKVGWGRWAVRGHTTDSASHRESISSQLPNTKPPLSPSLHAVEDSAVFSDSEDSDGGDDLEDERLDGRFEDDEVEGTDEEDWRSMGPASLRQTSPREQDAIAALVQLRSE